MRKIDNTPREVPANFLWRPFEKDCCCDAPKSQLLPWTGLNRILDGRPSGGLFPTRREITPQQPAPQQPQVASRPRLSDLLSRINTYGGGFNGHGTDGLSMAKDLISALYESPGRLREVIQSLSQADQRDDAAASFVRALLESGPEGGKLLKELPKDVKEALLQYIGTGDAWHDAKDAAYLMLAKVTDRSYYDKALDGSGLAINGVNVRSTVGFNNEATMKFIQLYEGAI